jgi:UDP-2,4-diacetamido-2,4,6-trideoxy-beta-L-altropyranose hydrolase
MIVFRVDASFQIGSGHVMRCLTLADAFREQGVECHFISRAHAGHLLELIRQRGFGVSVLPVELSSPQSVTSTKTNNEQDPEPAHAQWLGCDWQTDMNQTRIILAMLQPDWLVVDHYALDQRWETALLPYYKKLLVIDDLADRSHHCDLLLDQNLGRQPQDYANLVSAHCEVLTSTQYALLRPEFPALRAYSLHRRQQPVLKQILITMGGVDEPNATSQVLQVLKDCSLPKDCHISVIMGLRAPWLQQVQALAQKMPWTTKVLVNVSDMAQRMADSDLAIGAAGSTSWERCCLGLPTLMIVMADNQRAIAEALQGAGAAKILDDTSSVPLIGEVLSTFIANPSKLYDMSVAAAYIVDGLGTINLVSHLSVLENS